MRNIAILVAIVTSLLMPSSLLAEPARNPFCMIDVQGGTPTDKDLGKVWRLVSTVHALPGERRPIIYPSKRDGVWTIDETNTLVPFAGEFPSRYRIWNRIAMDPETGRFVGVNSGMGIFARDRGDPQFRKLFDWRVGPIQDPSSVEFIPRLKSFLVGNSEGVYLLSQDFQLQKLSLDQPVAGLKVGRIRDLPAYGALLVDLWNENGSWQVVRFDDGELVPLSTLAGGEFLVDVTVEQDGSILLRSNKSTRKAPLNRAPATPIVQGKTYVIEPQALLYLSKKSLRARSIKKTLKVFANEGLGEVKPDGVVPLPLPFNAKDETILGLFELSNNKVVLIFTKDSIYALQAEGPVTEIPGARESYVGDWIHVIPITDQTIVLRNNRFELLRDRRVSGQRSCQAEDAN